MSARRLWPVLALAVLLSGAHLVATPALWPVDETSHVAYADQLVRTGRLPTIDDPIPTGTDLPGMDQRLRWERMQGRDGRQDIWTSNHPPLPYAVQGVALAAGRAFGGGTGALVLARLTSVAWLLLAVWATAQLALLLAPRPAAGAPPGRRPALAPEDVAVAAATVVAATPTLAHLSGLVFNDVAAVAMSTLCLLVGVRAAVEGLTPRRLAAVGLLAGAAGLTRVSTLPAIGVMGLLVLYGWWRTPSGMRDPAGGLAAGARRALAVGVLAAVPAAAFYARNAALYGDVTASEALLSKFRRGLNDPVGELVTSSAFWTKLWDRMVGDLTTGHWGVGVRADVAEAVLVVVLLAAAVAVGRGVRNAAAAVRASGDGAPLLASGSALAALGAHPRRVAWALSALLPLALLVTAVQFHAAGGSLHGRYVLGGHAVIATGIVVLLAGLPRVGRWLAVGAALPLLGIHAALLEALLLHADLTWERAGQVLDLPMLMGGASAPVARTMTAVAGIAFTIAFARLDLVRAPADEQDEDRGRYARAPMRSMSESAAP